MLDVHLLMCSGRSSFKTTPYGINATCERLPIIRGIYMFGIGMPEMILILAVALIVLGPKKLPDLAKSLGRALREFKKATTELKESIDVDNELTDVKKAFDEMNDDIREAVDVNIDFDNKAQKVSESSNDKKSEKESKEEKVKGSLKDEEK